MTTFYSLFPIPKFLDAPYAGLHISDDAVRVIQFGQGGRSLEIAKYGSRTLAPGIVEAGYIKDEKALSAVIKDLVSKLGITTVVASIPEEKMYLFKTDVVANDNAQIRQGIEFKLEENVPLSPADAFFYYDIIPGEPAGKKSAVVSVAPRKVIDAYLMAIEGAGLKVLSFEVEPRSLARAFSSKKRDSTELIINIMNNKTGIYVIYNGTVSFTSTVLWGGNAVTDAIQKNLGLSPEEAKKIKEEAGYHDGKDTKKVLAAVQDTVGQIQQEIAKVHSYWIDHGEGRKEVSKIILCGVDSQLVGLMSHISPDPKIPVEVANVWSNAFSNDHYIPPISRDESLDYAVATGLALPQ